MQSCDCSCGHTSQTKGQTPSDSQTPSHPLPPPQAPGWHGEDTCMWEGFVPRRGTLGLEWGSWHTHPLPQGGGLPFSWMGEFGGDKEGQAFFKWGQVAPRLPLWERDPLSLSRVCVAQAGTVGKHWQIQHTLTRGNVLIPLTFFWSTAHTRECIDHKCTAQAVMGWMYLEREAQHRWRM